MKILEREIYKAKPRAFREKARILIESGDVIHSTYDNAPKVIGTVLFPTPQIVNAVRSVRKNGKPIGPWTCLIGYYPFKLPDTD